MDALGERRITLDQLRAFVTVAECGGFQAAGDRLGRTQSAVTQSLGALEEGLGQRLLDRRRGHLLGLTEAGRRFLPAARASLAQLAEAVDALRRPDLRGRIALGVPDDFAIAELPRLISRCHALYPGLTVEVTSTLSASLATLLRQGALDLALLRTTAGVPLDLPEPGVLLRVEPLHWVAHAPVPFTAPEPLPLCLYPDGCAYRAAGLAALAAAGRPVRLVYVSAIDTNLHAAIAAGLGVGLLPASAIGPGLVRLGPEDGFPPLAPVELRLVRRATAPLVRAFADLLQTAPGLMRG
ncbi:MAG: hypothetical protein RLZZ501_1304 [Pseudomonadota bacterium]